MEVEGGGAIHQCPRGCKGRFLRTASSAPFTKLPTSSSVSGSYLFCRETEPFGGAVQRTQRSLVEHACTAPARVQPGNPGNDNRWQSRNGKINTRVALCASYVQLIVPVLVVRFPANLHCLHFQFSGLGGCMMACCGGINGGR